MSPVPSPCHRFTLSSCHQRTREVYGLGVPASKLAAGTYHVPRRLTWIRLDLTRGGWEVRTSLLLAAGLVLALVSSVHAEEKEHEIITRVKKAKVNGPFILVVVVKVKEGQEKKLLEVAKPC